MIPCSISLVSWSLSKSAYIRYGKGIISELAVCLYIQLARDKKTRGTTLGYQLLQIYF